MADATTGTSGSRSGSLGGVVLAVLVAVALLAAVLLLGGGETAGPKGAGKEGGGPAAPGGGKAPAGGPGLPGGARAMETFIPNADKTGISPILKAVAAWPGRGGLTPVARAAKRPEPADLNNLRVLVEMLLAPEVRPPRFDDALVVDEAGAALFVQVGRAAGKDRCEGLATCHLVKGQVTFSVSFTFPDAAGPVSLAVLTQRLRSVVVPELAAELARPDFAPQASPVLNGPEGVAALAQLDRQGFGMMHPWLYLHAGPKTLVAVFQQIPDNKPGPPQGH